MAEGNEYPLHHLVWRNSYQELEQRLKRKVDDVEELDPRGRTPLMLAVTLGHLESTRVLLKHGCNVNVINRGGWTVVQEATATGDPELLQCVLEKRDRQRYSSRVGGIPELLEKLKSAPDFYVEMKWEFTSWVPFLSRICPSDTYKVYKQGSCVRIDTTLLGFDQSHWVRGDRTYIFQGKEDGAKLYEIDHDTRSVYCEEMKLLPIEQAEQYMQSDEQISTRLTNPLVLTYLDTDKINFERSRSGLWGWGGEKSEYVSGYNCKVFAANNVELITKTRTEHLTEEDKLRAKGQKNPLQSFLGMAEVEVRQKAMEGPTSSEYYSVNNPCCISPHEYFDAANDLHDRDIGRPREMSCKVQRFKAQLWLSEEYPLSLQEQVMPIVDLMAISNSHFQKLKDFITCSFPAGFPVKIEIPVFHVLNARITFGNIFGMNTAVNGIQVIQEDESRTSCVVDEDVFRIPANYSRLGGPATEQIRRQHMAEQDDDDQLLRYALRQSIGENEGENSAAAAVASAATASSQAQPVHNADGKAASGAADPGNEKVSIWEALQGDGPSPAADPRVNPVAYTESLKDRHLELQIQKAIELSLQDPQRQRESRDESASAGASSGESGSNAGAEAQSPSPSPAPAVSVQRQAASLSRQDEELLKAMELSQLEEDEIRKQREEEDETLKRVLAMSITEK